ncbi:MAG TPA: hypothetical protein VGP72_23415 [Planctomycetota bacterium]|jgi:hypothetical protein
MDTLSAVASVSTRPSPSPNGSTGRNPSTGRFAPGNPGGPGNPFAARVAKLRLQMLGSVSEDDMRSIVAAVVAKAKAGDLAAARVVFDYLVGKPQITVDPDRVDLDGEALASEKQRRETAKYQASMGYRTIL